MAAIRTYQVGKDLSYDRYEEIIAALAEWYKEFRPKVEPYDMAKYTIDCCLNGVQMRDGVSPWSKMAQSTLATRVRQAAQFDIDTMTPLRAKPKEARPPGEVEAGKADAKARKEEKLIARIADADSTYDSVKGLAKADAEYGDNPQIFFTSTELIRRNRLKEGYLADFPQLRAIAAQTKLDMLLDLTLLLDRLRFRQARSQSLRDTEEQIGKITKQILDLEKALNIHPDQLAKQLKEREGGTIGEAVRRLEEAVPAELRERWFLEELLMLWQMYHQPSPRNNMGGYQLDEVGLFGATRCRTCTCSGCGQHNYAGLEIEEIGTYLKEKGLLKPVPVPKPTPPVRQENEDTPHDENPPLDTPPEGDSGHAPVDRAADGS